MMDKSRLDYPVGFYNRKKAGVHLGGLSFICIKIVRVTEARKRSGTYITVTQALEQGKEVYVVPGRITDALSEGCNYLLNQGAGMAVSPESIVEELNRMGRFCNDAKKCENKEMLYDNKHIRTDNPLYEHILSVLDVTPIALDEIYHRLQDKIPLSMEQLLLELTKMQMTGTVETIGTYYRIPSPL